MEQPAEFNGIYEVRPAELISEPDKVKSIRKEIRKNIKQQSLYTLNYLASGADFNGKDLALGENKFIESGTCDPDTSSEKCKNKTKYTYVRNIPTGTIPPLNLSFFELTGCNLQGLTEGRGLIPGLVEDVYDINPIELTFAAAGRGNIGSDVCKEMTLPVGKRIYDKKKKGTHWNWETKCTAGHHSMTETTSNKLNKKILKKNSNIKKARMPGPLQLRENYNDFIDSEKKYQIPFWKLSVIIFLSSLILTKFSKRVL